MCSRETKSYGLRGCVQQIPCFMLGIKYLSQTIFCLIALRRKKTTLNLTISLWNFTQLRYLYLFFFCYNKYTQICFFLYWNSFMFFTRSLKSGIAARICCLYNTCMILCPPIYSSFFLPPLNWSRSRAPQRIVFIWTRRPFEICSHEITILRWCWRDSQYGSLYIFMRAFDSWHWI